MSRTVAFVTAGALALGMALTSQADDKSAERESLGRPRPDFGNGQTDFANMRCARFRALSAQNQGEVLAWLDGYGKSDRNVGDFGEVEFARDTRAIVEMCEDDSNAVLRRRLRSKMPSGAKGLRLDRMSCREFARLDSSVQSEVMAFADGYHARSESRPALRNRADYAWQAEQMGWACREDSRAILWDQLDSLPDRRERGDDEARDERDNASRMTCAEFSALTERERGQLLAWIDGYSKGDRSEREIGSAEFDRDTTDLVAACEERPNARLRNRLRSELPRGRKELTPGRMRCQDFAALGRGVQAEVVSFADGYYARNQSSAAGNSDAQLRKDFSDIRRACLRDPNVSFWEKIDLLSADKWK